MSWKHLKTEEAEKKLLAAHRRAVEKTCFVILAHSKLEVPLDEASLMRSGNVAMAPAPEAAGVIHYGGGPGTGHPIVPYAMRWHEEEAAFQHGRKNRYLLDPFNRLVTPTLKDAIVQETEGEF